MKKKYKALMLDLDGTTIPNRSDGLPSEKVIKAIEKASKIVHVGIATARPIFMLDGIIKNLKLSGPSVISSGAQIIDLPSRKVLWERTIDPNAYDRICDILIKYKVQFFIQDKQKEAKYLKDYGMKRILNIFCPGLEKRKIDLVVDDISQISTISIHQAPSFKSGKVDLIISDTLASKQHGIFEVAEILKIQTHEIIGVGDGYNDFPLLMACGLKVAIGNAVPELKEIADYIAPSVDEDGVADVIEKFILSQYLLK